MGLAFCSLYTLTYRTTWLVFPLSLLGLCWNCLSLHCSSISCCPAPSHQQEGEAGPGSRIEPESNSADEDSELEEIKKAMLFPTIKQKSILASIWFFSLLYGLATCFPEKVIFFIQLFYSLVCISIHFIMTKNIYFISQIFGEIRPEKHLKVGSLENQTELQSGRNSDLVFCPVRSQPGDALNNTTMFLSVYFPTFLGPVLTFLIFLITLPCTTRYSRGEMSCCSLLFLPILVIIYLFSYYTHIKLGEGLNLEKFNFILVKYCAGFAFIIIIPIFIILTVPEIRLGVRKTFKSSVLCASNNVGLDR